jgi:hypothetical protein
MTRKTVARKRPPPSNKPAEIPHACALRRSNDAWTVLEPDAVMV